MKEISTLIPDIYQLVERKDGWFSDDLARSLSEDIAGKLRSHLNKSENRPTLRLSQMGPRCPRALWYSIHHPEYAEALPPWAEIKYSFGHILEALAVTLAKASGHEVTGEQDAVTVDGVVGHRDCVIDGCIVDVKSASSINFQKFKTGAIAQEDSFGYLDQLDGYLVGSLEDPLVRVKDRAYLLAIDKTLGHMCLYEHYIREESIRGRIKEYKEIIGRDLPPPCTCGTVEDGESGNRKLDKKAGYNVFKYQCFPSLRTFLYAGGPRYLTKVVKRPMNKNGPIPEVDRYGRII